MTRSYSSTRRDQQAEDTRVRIIGALSELLLDHDPASVSVGEVAELAGVAERTVYRHFPTRDALFDGLQLHVAEQIRTRRGGALHSPDDLADAARHAFAVID